MALNYYDEIVQLFIDNYTLSFPVQFDDGRVYDMSGASPVVSSQPDDAPWLRVNTIPGTVANETIGTKDYIRQNELFNIVVQAFMPRRSTNEGKIYTTKDFADLSNHLNTFLKFDSIVTSDGACITLDQVNPTEADRVIPTAGDPWQQINFTYRYEYRFF